ncbi:hypothetical protein [Clostridium sp. UBA7503]|uniref:hypothetical protein n=1 Tax=Clostridium sp. UBA7503 TaxID=1946377 RepID=UPI0032169D63
MQSMLHHFDSIQLTTEEREESAIYVCYDRSLYHYLKRNSNMKNFNWLFADRFWGFLYSENNEPITPIQNGLSKIVDLITETLCVETEKLRGIMKEKFSDGYKAYAMFTVERPDGTLYVTSTLFEGMKDDLIYYTKTGKTCSLTCIPMEFKEFISKLPKDGEGKVTITFIRATESLIKKLKCSGVKLYKEIMKNLYGFYYDEGLVKQKYNPNLKINNIGLYELLNYFESYKKELVLNEISKRNQLRMHRHIANKIEPMLFAWNSILADTECSSIVGKEHSQAILNQSTIIRERLKSLLKWASMVFSRPNINFMNSYINELSALIKDFEIYQKLICEANAIILKN